MKTVFIYSLVLLLAQLSTFSFITPGVFLKSGHFASRFPVKSDYTAKITEQDNARVSLTHPLLRSVDLAGGIISVNPLRIYDNDVSGGGAGINRTITITNTGSGVLSLSSVSLTGANSNQFILSGLPGFPANINAGNFITFSVAFNPSSTGIKTASVDVSSNDASNPLTSIPVRGLGTAGLGGTNEPSLQSVLNLWEIETNVGDDNVSTNVINSSTTLQKAPLLGDEVSIQKFQKAGAGNVTLTPLSVFGPTDSSTIVGMGWYKSGNPASKAELLTVSNNPLSNGQTVNVNFTGTLSFDPASNAFGFYSRWPFFANRHLYSEDNLNTFTGSIPHHVRVYPYKKNGVLVPNSYVIAFEEHISGFDYQDILFIANNVKAAANLLTVAPIADAYVRDGSAGNVNYGSDTSLILKATAVTGLNRFSHLKFPINITKVNSAKLRLYGRNTESSASIPISVFGVDDDSWSENGITFNNAPAALASTLDSAGVTDEAKYYEFDVTEFVKFQLSTDQVAGFLVKNPTNADKTISFNSKENSQNPPQLVIDTTTVAPAAPSNALLFVENPDQFPSNDNFVFSRIQVPWTRDSVYNANHDSLKIRVHNKGISPLIITNLTLTNDTTWKIDKLNTTPYVPGAGLPIVLNSGTYLDVTMKFIAVDQATRVKVLHDTLIITSNDDKSPSKKVFLHGLWQRSGEGDHEPLIREIVSTFGFTTNTGINFTDPDMGDSTKLKGDEIKPSYFVRADTLLPVSIRQMGAYHGCCYPGSAERIQWYVKGTSTPTTVFTHVTKDGQTLLPRRSLAGLPATGTFLPSTPFGIRIGSTDWTDATKNPGKKIGIRVWKAFDPNGRIIPNAYIISNDYLGTPVTNYDYNDNTYFISNLKPETGTAFSSTLKTTPSALDFGDRVLQTTTSLPVNVKNYGQTYANGSSDPAVTIASIDIRGENRFEFTASLPASSILNPQQETVINVQFKPLSQGLKIADLLIYYSNSISPLRVPLYGIGRKADSAVVVNYRIKSGVSKEIIINGKTWSADTAYARDNLEPYKNPNPIQIAATDEDSLYLTEQSSNGDKKPFRYQIPLANGNYFVRLHFAEIFWGAPGAGSTGGAGSRVMSVKLENELRLVNFDIAQEVGSSSAVIKNFPVTITDSMLNIDFSASVNRPSLSAVEVYSFISSGPLAIGDQLDIKGTLTDKGIEVEWITANEKDTKCYEIQRLNNNAFITLDTLVASNLIQYTFTDTDPNFTDNFYRVKAVSIDGKVSYSKILRIDFSKGFGIKLFPNPTTNKIRIQFNGVARNQKATVSIQNLSGSILKLIPLTLSGQKIEVDVSSLSAGIYIIRLTTGNVVLNHKFFKR